MNIRPATPEDIPAIVMLSKLSLGESLMPKSTEFWKWKHEANPFGPSFVWVAEESGTLSGVRAFMRWEWMTNGKVYRAVRAVDTATHPMHQGKGIFTRLTGVVMEACKKDGVQFIFNTPNASSRPGYIKMGWMDIGRLPVRFSIGRFTLFQKAPQIDSFDVSNAIAQIPADAFHEMLLGPDHFMRTNYSSEYLLWRYAANPNVRYGGYGAEAGKGWVLYLFRLKPGRLGTELRICDILLSKMADRRKACRVFGNLASRLNPGWISCAPSPEVTIPELGLILPVGPRVTVRNLNLENHQLPSFDQWAPSLGDMEVF